MLVPSGVLQQLVPPAPTAVSFVSSSHLESYNTPNSTLSIPKPAGTLNGDLVLMISVSRNGYCAIPTGGTTFNSLRHNSIMSSGIAVGGSSNEDFRITWKIAGASEPANYSIVYTDSGTDGQQIYCMTFRGASGVNATSPLAASSASGAVTAATGDLIVAHHGTCFTATSETTVTEPAGMTLIGKDHEPNSDVGMAVAYEEILADGSTGSRTWTTQWLSYYWSGMVLIEAN